MKIPTPPSPKNSEMYALRPIVAKPHPASSTSPGCVPMQAKPLDRKP